MAKTRRERKGTFGDVRLPVARAYVRPASRNRFLALGAAGLVVLAALAGWSLLRHDAGLISNGPLTSAHAEYGSDCAVCHGGSRRVTDAACRDCHERRGGVAPTAANAAQAAGAAKAAGAASSAASAGPAGAAQAAGVGIYTVAAHWSVSPADQRRDASALEKLPEVSCAACHLEHRGRQAEIARVSDSLCLSCHDFGSFSTGHPEFDFAADEIPDSDSLLFTHSHHVNEVMRRRSLTDPEAACLTCHEPSPAGGGFRPIDFDRHCAACHLTAAVRTPPLPVAPVASAKGSGLGVETIETARRRGGPADRWADGLSTAEFLHFGDRVIKTPLRHRDPWVLHNLRLLRRRLYPNAGIADLLVTTGDASPGETRALYREAIATLERQAEALRARPERALQAELVKVEALLDELRRRVDTPGAHLDEGAFRLAGGERPDPAEVEAIDALAADLTKACRQCHLVRDATIVRVEPDQRTLRRAEFEHRPHVLQRGCLDCHNAIPITEYLGQEKGAPAAVDHASIQNLPRIATCRACHTPRRASQSCITCHAFHPDARQRAFAAAVTHPVPPQASDPGAGETPPSQEVSDAS